LFYACLRKWLVAMIAGWLDDEVVNQEILVFVGRQGIYKTTWFNALLPPVLKMFFHSNTSFGNMTKDEVLKLSMYGLICCEELDTMKPSEMNRLKWAVTTTVTDERRPYAHYAERRNHIASYCGTGNNTQFIDDETSSDDGSSSGDDGSSSGDESAGTSDSGDSSDGNATARARKRVRYNNVRFRR
jgi:predicted P-loop ATPase